MRVLFSSTSGYGHVFPMLPLARAFGAAGHDVLWAASADATPLLAGTGVETATAGLSGPSLLARRQTLLRAAEQLPPQERAGFIFPRMFGATFTPAMVDDLLPLAAAWQPDLLVHENGEFAAPVVAAVLALPCITHAFGGPVPRELLSAVGEEVASVWSGHGQSLPPYAGCFSAGYVDLCPRSVQTVPADHIGSIQPLRPVSDIGAAPGELPDYLRDDGRPLIYLTLGTVRNNSPALRRIAGALAGLPVRLLVTVGPDGDPEALADRSANVRVERWVHQPQVLEHCDVVVSHAGSGTFLGALAMGLPQVCLPQAADQFHNADGGHHVGAALALTPAETSAEAVAAAATRLLSEPGFRTAAESVAAEIAGMPSPHEVVDVLMRRLG